MFAYLFFKSIFKIHLPNKFIVLIPRMLTLFLHQVTFEHSSVPVAVPNTGLIEMRSLVLRELA